MQTLIDKQSDQIETLDQMAYSLQLSLEKVFDNLTEMIESMGLAYLLRELSMTANAIKSQHEAIASNLNRISKLEMAKDNLQLKLSLEWRRRDDINLTDPATGRKNKDYSDLLLREYLASNEEYQYLVDELESTKRQLQLDRAELNGLEAVFRALRHSTALRAAELSFLAQPYEMTKIMQSFRAANTPKDDQEVD